MARSIFSIWAEFSFFHWLGAAVTCTSLKKTGDRADYLGLMNGNEATNY